EPVSVRLAVVPAVEASGCSLAGSFHGHSVVGLAHLVGYVLGISYTVVAIYHKHGPLQEAPLFDEHAVVLPELLAFVGRQRPVGYPLGVMPAGLRVRQVHAYGIDLHSLGHFGAQLIPLLR